MLFMQLPTRVLFALILFGINYSVFPGIHHLGEIKHQAF